jgi:hypothetical protein
LTPNLLTDDLLLERILTCDRLTNDSLLGIRLLAEMVRSPVAPGHEYLRVLNYRTRLWRERAQKLFDTRVAGRPHGWSREQRRGAGVDHA